MVTPIHVLGLLVRRGIIFSNDTVGGSPSASKVQRYVHKYADFFADLCCQDYSFQRHKPTRLAAAIVVAIRRALGVKPLFNTALSA